MSFNAGHEENDTSFGAIRTTGPYRRCISWIYRVRFASNSLYLRTNDVNLDIAGPGSFDKGEEVRRRMNNVMAPNAAMAIPRGESKSMSAGDA